MVRTIALGLCLILSLPLRAAESPLADHPSPYISMHADDPVEWRLWDESLLTVAQQRKRLIFISSGYFACHWCHVMQRESFQDSDIAEMLNRGFIPVKIDRELWPELDAYLIDFVEQTRGRAGWPLNVFITPEGDPLVGTTYLPPEEFSAFLRRLQERWQKEGDMLSGLARRAAQSMPVSGGTHREPAAVRQALQRALLQAWEEQGDVLAGGFGQQAKFPDVPQLRALTELAAPDSELEAFIRLTLEQMADGGLRDQLAGGFFRYTVDPGWSEPHFEKMLVDNAQLALFYLDLGARWQSERYRKIGLETLDFLLADMRHPQGGFVSALSAVDGDGSEGGYYLWTESQLRRALGERLAEKALEIWVLHRAEAWSEGGLLLPAGKPEAVGGAVRERVRRLLLQARSQRQLPRDSKRLAAANGVMLSALSRGSTEAERYRMAAVEVRDYLYSLWDGVQLWRMRDGRGERVRGAGLDDYVQVARGLLDWYEVSGDVRARGLAVRLTKEAWERFYTPAGWKLAGLVKSRLALRDEVLPSAVSVLVEVNQRLGGAAPLSAAQLHRAVTMAQPLLIAQPLDYASYLRALQRLGNGTSAGR